MKSLREHQTLLVCNWFIMPWNDPFKAHWIFSSCISACVVKTARNAQTFKASVKSRKQYNQYQNHFQANNNIQKHSVKTWWDWCRERNNHDNVVPKQIKDYLITKLGNSLCKCISHRQKHAGKHANMLFSTAFWYCTAFKMNLYCSRQRSIWILIS